MIHLLSTSTNPTAKLWWLPSFVTTCLIYGADDNFNLNLSLSTIHHFSVIFSYFVSLSFFHNSGVLTHKSASFEVTSHHIFLNFFFNLLFFLWISDLSIDASETFQPLPLIAGCFVYSLALYTYILPSQWIVFRIRY